MASKQTGGKPEEEEEVSADPMAAAERQAAGGAKAPAFVSAKQNVNARPDDADEQPAQAANAEEIHISDDEDL